MNNYIDAYGRYHDKIVTESNPSPSNNGWLYTAYAAKAGLPVNMRTLGPAFNDCRVGDKILLRSPGILTPPISRDEILGMVALGLLKPKKDASIGWVYSPYLLPKFSFTKLLAQLWKLKPEVSFTKQFPFMAITPKHRNYFWENNLDQIYRFAFSVPLVDRHFILQKWGKYSPIYHLIAKIDSLGAASGLKYLKYGKSAEAMVKEFPVDHPIRVKLGL